MRFLRVKSLSVTFFLVLFLSGVFFAVPSFSATFVEFDNLPVTPESSIPTSGGGWTYGHSSSGSSKYTRDTAYAADSSVFDSMYTYSSSINTEHMGFENYGFLQITDQKSITGNSLEYVITGGKNITTCPDADHCDGNGLPLRNKQTYLDYINNGQNPVEGGMVVGVPYLYFANGTDVSNPLHFEQAQGNNRLSVYVWLPSGLSVGDGGYNTPAYSTIDLGPYSDVPRDEVFPDYIGTDRIGGHWYSRFTINSGGWIHLQMDGHPQHNNGWNNASLYPYPSYSMRDMGSSFFTNLHRLYITTKPYNGFDTPKFSMYVDKMEFINDTESQNNETISSVAILYKENSKSFEIGFMDKYKNNGHSFSTYELRYSFSPITNANWSSATPAVMQEHTGFHIQNRTDGKFQKWWPYYQNVWAGFTLTPADTNNLTAGTVVYFAVKDIGNLDANGDPTQTPNDGINGYWGASHGGRDYAGYPSDFDWEGDSAVLSLIKRVDYQIAGGSVIGAPGDLRID